MHIAVDVLRPSKPDDPGVYITLFDKKKIQIKEAIRTPGMHIVPVKLHQKVTAELKVHVGEA